MAKYRSIFIRYRITIIILKPIIIIKKTCCITTIFYRFVCEPGRFINENEEPVIAQSDWFVRIVHIINTIIYIVKP